MQEYLDEKVGSCTRRTILYQVSDLTNFRVMLGNKLCVVNGVSARFNRILTWNIQFYYVPPKLIMDEICCLYAFNAYYMLVFF